MKLPHKPSDITRTFLLNENAIRAFISKFFYRREDIEDISQETFTRAYKAEQTTKIRHPKAFLYRTARNIALNELKKKSTVMTDYISDKCNFDVISTEPLLDQQYEDREKFQIFCKAIDALPPQCQRVFILRRVYGFTQKEISKELNISVSTVEKHITNGLKRCRQTLLNFDARHNNATHITKIHIENSKRP